MPHQQPSSPPRVLIADDQQDVLTALRVLLRGQGFVTQEVQSPEALFEVVRSSGFDVVLMDLNYTRGHTTGTEGLALLEKIAGHDPTIAVVVMTAWSNVELAVDAMRHGARDFIEKPWNNERLLSLLRTQVDLRRTASRADRLEQENAVLRAGAEPDSGFIAESAAMRPVLEMIQRIGPADANVLVTGESGVGKGVVARALHAASERASNAMITVNTGGLSEGLFESELFGHVKGAFTDARADRAGRFEVADGGTLFLDEIANLSMAMQARLLRVLETGEFERVGSSQTRRADVRIVSATNADLLADSQDGRFRQDLLYRLNTIEIKVPPLRDRAEDIEPLAAHFLERYAARYRKTVHAFATEALSAMQAHSWLGNVRELDHAVERGVLMAAEDLVTLADLGLGKAAPAEQSLDAMSLEEVETYLIRRALGRSGGNVKDAAEMLGLSRSGLYRRLQKYGIDPSLQTATPQAGLK